MSLPEGTILDNRYRVIRPLGEGGFGAAYLVEDRRLERRCVAKASTAHDATHHEQFEQEARILAALEHPNLPDVYDYFFDCGCPYLIMQYVEGVTLDRLKEGRSAPFEVRRVLRWANDLLGALIYLHGQEPPIIHRDIKPSNVCITHEGKAILLDFGIARRLDSTCTHTGAQASSWFYSPIEQYPPEATKSYVSLRKYMQELDVEGIHTGPYSDVYSLGATLYFALTLLDPPDARLRKVEEGLRPIREINPDVPDFLAQALEHALAVDPRNRCQSATELWQLLQPQITGGKAKMYTAEISRKNPTCFFFLIDQSYSMVDPFGGSEIETSKAAALADILNRLLYTLVVGRCAKDEGIRRYFQVGVIGYGATVGPAFYGELAGRELVWTDEIANHARIEERQRKIYDGAGGLVEVTDTFKVWFDPIANGGTPMCQALWQAHTILQDWITQHPMAFPPVVINITDGESTDGDPYPASEAIRELATEDGNVLLLNLHLSSRQGSPIHFPDSEDGLPDEYARLLFRMSSLLPGHMQAMARETYNEVSDTARGFFFNADIKDVIEFLDIGTRHTENMR